jgi:predicted component of type VI protein secretion system
MLNEVEIGGQLVPQQSFEAIANISSNKTLLVQKLTTNPTKLEPVKGLKTIDDVFNHFKPMLEVEFEEENGATRKEELNFNSLLDFKKDGIINQSDFLKKYQTQQDACFAIVKKLRTNKILKTALQNPEAKKSFLQALQAAINEIDSANA